MSLLLRPAVEWMHFRAAIQIFLIPKTPQATAPLRQSSGI